MQARHFTVILNNATGAEKQGSLRDRLIEIFKEHNINPEIHLAKRGDGLTTIAEAAARNGCFAMAAGRGNGTERLSRIAGIGLPDDHIQMAWYEASGFRGGVGLVVFDDSWAFLNGEELIGGDVRKSLHLLVVGQWTSIGSTRGASPKPKWRRRSLCDITLVPAWTSSICACFPVITFTRAPVAVRLHWVPSNLMVIQFFLLPPSFRRSDG